MSVVSNIILSFSIMEDFREEDDKDVIILMDDVNDWLTERGKGTFGGDVNDVLGGTKHLETPVYVAAFNHFDIEAFIAFIKTLPWREPENVQLFVKGQEENKFALIGFGTGEEPQP